MYNHHLYEPKHPLTGFYTTHHFLKEQYQELEYPVAIAVFDITQLRQLNEDNGYSEGDFTIFDLSNVIKHCALLDSCFVHDLDARLILIQQNATEKDIIPVADSIQKEYEKLSYGISYAEGPMMISIAIDEAKEDARLRQMLNPNSNKSEVLNIIEYALSKFDNETYEHVMRTQELSEKIADKLDMSHLNKTKLKFLCQLHDIGKIDVPIEILRKPGKLTDEEYEIIKQHADAGADLIETLPSLSEFAEYIRQHHERWDGKGYPQKLSGHSIPLFSRIISLVDAYDAMSHDRVYRKALSEREIVLELSESAGKQFDPHLCGILIAMIIEHEI